MPARRPPATVSAAALARLATAPQRRPPRDALTPAERRLVAALRTPAQVQRHLRTVPYNRAHTLHTFRGVVAAGTAHCLEAVLFAATVLGYHGHPPLVLDLESEDRLDHVVFLFRAGGRWGAVARSRDEGLHGRAPVFRSVRDLARSYMDPYVDGEGRLFGYGAAHLDALTPADWRLGTRSVWRVEQALIDLPHRRFRMGDRRYARVLHAFERFRARGAPPTRRALRGLYGAQVSAWW